MLKHSLRFTLLAAIIFTVVSLSAASPRPIRNGWEPGPHAHAGRRYQYPLFSSVTMREIVHISAAASRFVCASPMSSVSIPHVADVHVALSAGGASSSRERSRRHFWRSRIRQHPPAAPFSPIRCAHCRPALRSRVSFYLPAQIMRAETYHSFADQDNYLATATHRRLT